MSKLIMRILAVLFAACLLQGMCIPILAAGETDNDFVIDFEDETIGSSPINSAITAVGVSEENTVTVVADPDDADNKVIKINRQDTTTRPCLLVNFPEQSGAFTVEYRIMFGGDAQYAAVLQSGTGGDKEAVYLLARDQSYTSNPGELLNYDGAGWNTLFGKSEFKYNEWYFVKIDMDLESYKYDIAVTDQSGVTRTSTEVGLKSAGITCLDYLNFQTAGSNAATLYVDSIKVSGAAQEGDDPEDSVMPETPDVAFDFETDAEGSEPEYVEISGMTNVSSIKVVADPSASNGKAVLMSDADVASAALKVTAPFAEKTDTVTMAFKMMFGDKSGDYIVNVLREEDEGVCGPRLLARAGTLRYIDGSGNWVTFNADYAVDTWYSFVIVANISNHTYSLYVDDVEIAKDAAFETDVDKISKLQFTTARALNGELYLDDIAVEDPIKIEPEEPEIPEDTENPQPPTIVFDFETEVVGREPKYIEIGGMTDVSSIKVVADPSASSGKALLMKDADVASPALKVTAPFTAKSGIVTMAFKMMFGDKTSDYIVNVLREEDEGVCGPRLLARAGTLRYIDGSGNWVTFNDDYAVNTWYSFFIVANVSTHTHTIFMWMKM